jgi:hypothetical protein
MFPGTFVCLTDHVDLFNSPMSKGANRYQAELDTSLNLAKSNLNSNNEMLEEALKRDFQSAIDVRCHHAKSG